MNPVGEIAARGDEDDGHPQRPNEVHEREAVHLGEHHVQKHQIESATLQDADHIIAITCAYAVVPLLGERQADEV